MPDDTKQTQEVNATHRMAKRTAKNSVFLDLFQDKKNLLKLYKTLHPEDTDATEDTLDIVTIDNVLTDNLYNDLGIMVGNDRLFFIVFCKVFDEQRKLYGMTEQTVKETIRICKDRNILKEYLISREKEVVTIIMSLFDDEQIMKTYWKDMENTLTDKITHDKDREIAERLIKKGKMSLEDIADCVPALSFNELKKIETEVMQLA